MATRIRITAVGGLVQPVDDDRYRPVVRGDEVTVSDEDATRLITAGTAEAVDQTIAEHAEAEQPEPGAIDLSEDGATVAELRKFASARRINLGGAQKRADIVEAIEGALTEPGDE